MTGKASGFRKRPSGAESKRKAVEKERREQDVLQKTRKLDLFFSSNKRAKADDSEAISSRHNENYVISGDCDDEADDNGSGGGCCGGGIGDGNDGIGDGNDGIGDSFVCTDSAADRPQEAQCPEVVPSLSISEGGDVAAVMSAPAPYRIADSSSASFTQCERPRFSDWAHARDRIADHENSSSHRDCLIKFRDCKNEIGRIDHELRVQITKEQEYWKNVLRRVVSVIKKLASRGLAFRGTDETFGSVSNGNFMMCLELISEYDPFLADHIARHGSTGRGNVSYLSSTIYEELIELMGKSVLEHVVKLVKIAKYYAVIVDSTRDLNKKDQLTLLVRYVNTTGIPEERFLTFIENCGHTGEEMAESVLKYLAFVDLSIEDCRGQSYDNAANMSGKFKGLQARLKAANSVITYVPCALHSMNLSGSSAAESCKMTVVYFDFLQSVYNFISSSTHRWAIFLSFCEEEKDSRTLKTLSSTRFNAREKACEALNSSAKSLAKTLQCLADDESLKEVDRIKARAFLRQLRSFDIIFMSIVWKAIFLRFGKILHDIQSKQMHVSRALSLYDSLVGFLEELKTSFPTYFETAKEKHRELRSFKNDDTGDESGEADERPKRHRRRKRFFDDSEDEEEQEVQADEEINGELANQSFNIILQTLIDDVRERAAAYREFALKFSFLTELPSLESAQISEATAQLIQAYKEDLESSLFEECLHLKSYLNQLAASTTSNSEALGLTDLSLSKLYQFLIEKNLQDVYPNVSIALHIYLTVPVTNCSAERSFSAMGRVHNYLRTSQQQERLVNVAIMSMESDITMQLDFEDIIEKFARAKARKKNF
ncbi:zinc finger MYM-type protein 1-like [Bemisia tabaci]|uniref:zinc finger MYM-type protein 1-like n=1 Tax=Bemisia tabaci TaxID=7038 RepID=UPI003B288764